MLKKFIYWFIKPQILFSFGVIQALFPYCIWFLFGENEGYSVEITEMSIFLWMSGLSSFYLGTKLISRKNYLKSNFIFNYRLLNIFYYLVLMVYFLILIYEIYIYNGIPFFKFFNNEINIQEVNDIQAISGSSIFGIAHLFWLTLLSTITIILGGSLINNRKISIFIVLGLVLVIFGAILSGKRQNILILISILLPSSFLFLENIDVSHRRNEIFKILSSSAVWSIVLAVIFFVVVGSLRNGAEISSGFYQISQYLQFPLINLEWQIAEFGLFWGQSNWFPLISGMIPHKLLASSDISQSMAQLVFGFTYPEPGIGAGYFGPAHLALGLTGVIVYGFFTGLVSAFFYSKSQISVVWIVPYSFFIWPLISAHSYNHFLTLLFFPAPLLISLALSKITIKTVKS